MANVQTALDRVKEYWGESAPDWVVQLAQECDQTSQKKAAKAIGYSPAAVNTLLKKAYKADLKALEQAVRGAFMDKVVQCPILGEIKANVCLQNQRLPFAMTNPMRVRLYRVCRRCPNNITDKDK